MTWWRLSIAALVYGIAIMGFARTSADPDLWGHLRFGLDLLETGRVIRPDPYSYLTAGVVWVNHEWVAEMSMGLFWRAAGALGAPATGLVLLKLVMVIAVVTVLHRHLLWRGLSAIGAATIVIAYLPILLPWLGAVRPQMFTYVLFAITLVAIARAEQESHSPARPLLPGDREGRGGNEGTQRSSMARAQTSAGVLSGARVLWVLPPVFALWANSHGGFLAGGGMCALWLMARAVQHLAGRRDGVVWRDEMRRVWLPVAVAGLATLATPYAGELWLFLRTALTPRLEIAEWNPIVASGPEGFFYLAALAPTVAGWIWSRREKRPALLFLYMVAVLLPAAARRHTPLFAIALVVFAGEHMADAAARMFERRRPAGEPFTPPRWMAIAFMLMAAACAALSLPHFRQVHVDRDSFPVEAVRLLASSGVETNMATEFAWGEYVLWHVGPRIKVSTDGRRETVYSDAAYEETLQFMYGYGKWDAVLEHDGVELALVPTRTWPTYNLMRLKPGWTVIYQDDRSALFGREGSPVTARVRALPKPARAPEELTFP